VNPQFIEPIERLSYKKEIMSITVINLYVRRYMSTIEMVGVSMRIFSFSLVSWLGPASPFMFVWIFNTVDAIMLSWCSILKKDKAYTLLNMFWIMVGVIGILRAGGYLIDPAR
jgi:hypothetical protein